MWGTSNSSYGNYYSSSQYSPAKTFQLYTPVKSYYPKGLQNLTNTCYISAVLQILFLIFNEKDFSTSSKFNKQITSLFFKLKNTKQTHDYRELKQALQNKIDIVRGWDQQDAQQFLIHFLEVLGKQNSQTVRKEKADLSYNQKKDAKTNWLNFIRQMQKLQKSPINNLFCGEILISYTCQQKHTKHKFERYLNLSLPFSPKINYSSYVYSEGPLKIQDMLLEYLADQFIDDLQCESCKGKVRFKKTSSIYTTPNFLVFHLSRFKKGYYNSQKNNRQVIYSDRFYFNDERLRKNIQYRLIGTVHHKGSLDRGHYYANIRVNNQWYEMNDETVQEVSIRSTNYSTSVYLLFYERVV